MVGGEILGDEKILKIVVVWRRRLNSKMVGGRLKSHRLFVEYFAGLNTFRRRENFLFVRTRLAANFYFIERKCSGMKNQFIFELLGFKVKSRRFRPRLKFDAKRGRK